MATSVESGIARLGASLRVISATSTEEVDEPPSVESGSARSTCSKCSKDLVREAIAALEAEDIDGAKACLLRFLRGDDEPTQ